MLAIILAQFESKLSLSTLVQSFLPDSAEKQGCEVIKVIGGLWLRDKKLRISGCSWFLKKK
jgi:hypothetical protein